MTNELSAEHRSLRDATLDIERHVASGGWDGPIRMFALIRAQAALAQNPELANELPADVHAQSITDPHLLFSVEQEDLPQTSSLEELLGQIVWPPEVDGTALSIERIVLPPSAEKDIPEDPAQAQLFLQQHPEREDVRMVVAAMRDGTTWSVIRMRSHDADADVLSGENLVEGLTAALRTTFE
ncbi:PPA1309 family protein [Arcanobacterium phocae]|uniref:PPA1309 family protein n=1 Tax=Arcanobacterium phocae TaxID=131112 RepID=UPI001C0F096B|nr:PPA1309 family protein [Arcanobacterium phocae]